MAAAPPPSTTPVPPPATTRAAEPGAAAATRPNPDSPIEKLVAKLDSSRLRWSFCWWEPGATKPQPVAVEVKSGLESVGWSLFGGGYLIATGESLRNPIDDEEVLRHLVKAMDDPTKIAAAHCELRRRGICLGAAGQEVPGVPDRIEATKPPAEPFLYNWGGLVVELSPTGKRNEGVGAGGVMESYPCRARIDPAQFPALRARWQKLLESRSYKWPR